MLLECDISEKIFGIKSLFSAVKFSVNDGEKIGLIGRNGIGKTTLLRILTGQDTDFIGDVVIRRGASVLSTQQEYPPTNLLAIDFILNGLPNFTKLHHILSKFPSLENPTKSDINRYSDALDEFGRRDYYSIENRARALLDDFGLGAKAEQNFDSLSGGEKRLCEVVKIMTSRADLAIVDEPTNFMDFAAKAKFIDWLNSAKQAVIVISHDRDVLENVAKIIEIKDGQSLIYRGNYDDYIRQNATSTASGMNEYETVQRRIANLKKQVAYAKRHKSSWTGTADKRNPFVVMENRARKQITELDKVQKPSFWVDKTSAAEFNPKQQTRYDKYKERNIRIGLKSGADGGGREILRGENLAVGYNAPLFSGKNFRLNAGATLEIHGRNGAGKSTLIKAILASRSDEFNRYDRQSVGTSHPALRGASPSLTGWRGTDGLAANTSDKISQTENANPGNSNSENSTKNFSTAEPRIFAGEIWLDPNLRVGIYHQETDRALFDLSLRDAISKIYDDEISETRVRQILHDYLFEEENLATPVGQLSGGQKARLQIIQMLARDPQLLILDEPTSHLDLPSIEELETALANYAGAIIYVSHDNFFRRELGGDVLEIP
ncbi:MAG: ATP-binding cassette domain-containing protein [Candidatus Nomurabacteria bacterium]|jgi:ATPase subunit of ABC transporter with duplicated ATPase domains|nr:ATP-binding cassette domain-containing protein [Candidatus Nomurabacteria bacterium]